jgi:hypothetical protein
MAGRRKLTKKELDIIIEFFNLLAEIEAKEKRNEQK